MPANHSMNISTTDIPADLRGKTVELEGYGRGSIVDQTEHSVGILLDGEGCSVVYVKIADLIPQ